MDMRAVGPRTNRLRSADPCKAMCVSWRREHGSTFAPRCPELALIQASTLNRFHKEQSVAARLFPAAFSGASLAPRHAGHLGRWSRPWCVMTRASGITSRTGSNRGVVSSTGCSILAWSIGSSRTSCSTRYSACCSGKSCRGCHTRRTFSSPVGKSVENRCLLERVRRGHDVTSFVGRAR